MPRDAPILAVFGLRSDFPELCLDESAGRRFGCLPGRTGPDLWLHWFERRLDRLALFSSDGGERHCVTTGDELICEWGLPRLLRERVLEQTGLRENPLMPPPAQREPAMLVVHHAPYALATMQPFATTWADVRRDLQSWSAMQRAIFATLDRAV
jgi:hypothetical protein